MFSIPLKLFPAIVIEFCKAVAVLELPVILATISLLNVFCPEIVSSPVNPIFVSIFVSNVS